MAGRGLLSALAFLSVIGRGRPLTPGAGRWFWLVGLLLGTAVGGAWWATTERSGPLLGATVAVAVDLVLTGALHLDGLADAGDGLLAAAPPERRLEIMRDPRAGAFAVAVVGAVLLLRVAGLATVEPNVAVAAGLWSVARAGAAVVPRLVAPARPGGAGTAVLGVPPAWLVIGLGPGAVAVVAGAPSPGAGAAGLAASLAGFAAVVVLARRRIGGWTGDVLGAGIVLGETFGLLGLALGAGR